MIDVNAVLDIRVFPQYPRKIILSWDTVSEDLPYPIAANIFRSGSSEGEFEKINTQPVVESFYEDIGLKPLSKLFDVTYKIEFIFPFTEKRQTVGPIYLATNPRLKKAYLVAKRMDQKHSIEYRGHSGIELKIFKQKHWGTRCLECFDPVTEESFKTDCGNCFGTSFEGGFWNPVTILAKIEPFPKVQVIDGTFGVREDLSSQAHIRAFPIVKKGDFIVETANNNRHYINSVRLVEHTRFPVKQLVEISTIERSSPLYTL